MNPVVAAGAKLIGRTVGQVLGRSTIIYMSSGASKAAIAATGGTTVVLLAGVAGSVYLGSKLIDKKNIKIGDSYIVDTENSVLKNYKNLKGSIII